MGKDRRLWPLSHPVASTTLFFLISSVSFLQASAQSISTNTPVPPLQWINLTGLLTGPGPGPLKDASIGYDPAHQDLIIFGGESAQGIPQAQTYLLDLQTLTWSQPTAPDDTPAQSPPARSAAISGQDLAASYRNGHVVIGGRGNDGEPLNDTWEFDYTNHFWSQVKITTPGPSVFAAAGGNDPRTPFDATALSNFFFVAGGFTGEKATSLSNIWKLTIAGTLSSNLPNLTTGTWEQIHPNNQSLPAVGGSATAVVLQGSQQHVVAVGGCDTSTNSTAACAQGQPYVIDIDTSSNTAPANCPAPRIGASLAPNLNTASQSFDQQVFLLLGTFDSSQWQDDGGLDQGEVDVFNFNAGTWARILPAGDPVDGHPTFPSPREGAAVFSLGQPLVGSAAASDTIVFGGKDATGNYLSEVWVLRAYNGTISQSNATWSGFGNGQLQGGPSANGQGVTIQYMSSCASAISQPSGTGSSSGHSPTSSSKPPSPTNTGQPIPVSRFDTSTVHKSLAPVSAALILPA
ncbi:uncharacterized protein PHACADRAFT_86460, partial [Phanerochaete carnosa HHB-10118-sp]